MNSEALGAMRELFAEIDAAIPNDQASQTDRARQLFGLLDREGGIVEPLEAPAFQRTRVDDLGTWAEDPWGTPTYGVDASTTRPLEYTNGLVVDAAYAKTAVAGAPDKAGIEQQGRLVTVAYHGDSDSRLHGKRLEGEYVTADLVRFPTVADEPQNIAKAVAAVAQRMSEGRRAVASLDAIDGALFLDGSIFPLGIVYWVLLDHAGNRSPAGAWDAPQEIVKQYIEIIDHQYERDRPVIGIVKTSSMAQVLEALETKIARHDIRGDDGRPVDVPWTRDHQFMAEVLRYDDLEYLTYTSWFLSKGQEIAGDRLDTMAPLADDLEHGTPTDYRRAFCYVRLPKTGDILRIETPVLMLQTSEQRQRVRLKALKEIAKRRGVPLAVDRADRIARISQTNRDTIQDMLENTDATFDHNWDGRWDDTEDTTDL